jgi:chromosome segregation ATPase
MEVELLEKPLTKLKHRWDSSDPDRAPPPLPLNPAIGQSPVRANASATVQAAANALADRARANTGPGPYTFNTMADRLPEKSPTRTPQHRRLQNLQGGGLKENMKPSNSENTKPGDWLHSPRPSTPTYGKDIFMSSPERSHSRADSLARTDSQSTQKDLFGSTPTLRHSSRPPIRGILSESSPRSPTMLAIQNMPHRDVSPVPTTNKDVSTSAVPTITYPTPSNLEAIHAQMLNLTNIATTLQKEMSALSRRSKDNATDLISIKEATNTRDEDIRKTLKDLATSVKTSDTGLHGAISGLAAFSTSRPTSVFASHSPNYLDNKPYHSPPFAKSTSLPRLDYSGSDIDRSGSPYSLEGAASLAMLEKILREMVTKDGHERLLSTVSGMLENANKESNGTSKKMERLLEHMQEKSAHQSALVKRVSIGEGPPKLELDFDGTMPVAIGRDTKVAEAITKEVQEMLQKIKDSISQSGGMTGEVKNLVRELRGEVLGMGREIGRKLDEQVSSKSATSEVQMSGEDMRSVIQEALAELKEQMENVVQSQRRQSSGSAVSKMTVEDSSVYAVVKHALAEHAADSKVDQAAILTAVKEAYEAYKPEIELQQFGLERDEILECLKEGLDDHRNSKATAPSAVTREEVLGAVQEALQHFTPPAPVSEAAEVKEELLATVKECLNEHATQTRDMVTQSGTSLTAEQMLDVVKAALEQSPGSQNEEVLNTLHDILAGMRGELRQFSASSDVHNEQALACITTGLEALRMEISAIAQHGNSASLAEEVNNTITDGLNNVRSTLEDHLASTQQSDRSLTTEAVQAEFDRMHEALASHPGASTEHDTEAIISSLHGSFEELKATIQTRGIDEPMEDIMEAIKADFDALRDGILQGTAAQRDELLDSLQHALSNINGQSTTLGADAVTTAAIIAVIKDEFDALKESMAMSMMPVTNLDDKQHDTTATVKQALQDMRVQLSADQNDNAADTLGVLKEELHQFRESFASAVVPAAAGSGANIELLEAIRDGLDGLRNYSNRNEIDGATSDAVEAVRDEMEQLRESIQAAVVKSSADADETLEAIKDSMNSLKAKLENVSPGAESAASVDVLEALGAGLVELKTEFAKLADKPIDMTTSYETLDLLKSGHSAILFEIESLRADFEKAQKEKDNEMVLADKNISARDMAEESAPRTAYKADLDKLEVMLAQLQIKIEAMSQDKDNNMNDTSGAATLQAIANLEAMLEVLQATVAAGSHRAQAATNSATKEDTDAIEVLLLNTKARIEDELLPAIKGNVTKDDLDSVEALVRLTGESVDTLSGRLPDNVATKDDLIVLESTFEGVTATLQAVKEQIGALNAEDSTLHSDIETLQTLCAEMQTKLDVLPADGQVSAKADIEQVVETMQALQQGLDKLQLSHENDIEVTAKAFDDRETESKSILEQIDQVKLAVEESRDELKTRLKRGTKDVRALDEILQAIEERMDTAPNAVPKVEEMADLLKAEFERAHGSLETLTTNLENKTAAIMDKHDDVRTAIIAGVAAKVDERFEEQKGITSQASDSIDLIARDLAGRAQQQEALLNDSRALSDELKLTIDTLGASVTSITPALAEATEKMSDDSRTVFNKIEQIHSKLEVDHAEAKDEHELTRAHLAKSLSTISLVREQLSQDHPKVMETLTSLLTLTGEHFEHSKKHAEVTADTQNDVRGLRDLPRLMAAPASTSNAAETSSRYVDQNLQDKLDELLKYAATSQNNTANLEKLGQIHEQVMSTAAEVSAFVAFQTKMITAVHDNKEEEAKDAAVNLSKNIAEAQQLGSKIINLQDAKDNLAADIEALMAERDSLTSQKMRLNAEVSSLHTALEIRREELEIMDNRADALHRRIVEGVMNQSRALLMTKPKKNVNMNLKRVGSNVSRATDATTTPSTLVSNGVGMAMNKPALRKNDTPLSAGGRRIVSLGTTTGNTTPRGQRHAMSRNVTTGPISLKRVQSIKNSRLRNTTDNDKENSTQHRLSDVAESARSTSYAGSSGRSASYGTQRSEYSYGTGSYLTGSDLSDRRTSYGFSEANIDNRDRSSIGSTIRSGRVGASEYAESIYEDEEDEGETERDEEITPEASPAIEQALEIEDDGNQQAHMGLQKQQGENRHGDSDSGLGSDLPTAALSAQDFGGYFPDRKEEDHMMIEG